MLKLCSLCNETIIFLSIFLLPLVKSTTTAAAFVKKYYLCLDYAYWAKE